MIGIVAALLLNFAPAHRCEITRDDNGHISRSRETVVQFKKTHPNPDCVGTKMVKTKKGKLVKVSKCVVDHDCALRCGGCDEVENMHWQTWEEGKKKDAWEGTHDGCMKTCGFAPPNAK